MHEDAGGEGEEEGLLGGWTGARQRKMKLSPQRSVSILVCSAVLSVGGWFSAGRLLGGAQADADPVVATFSPEEPVQGLLRAPPVELAEGMDHAAPHLALSGGGRLAVAWVSYEEGRERILLRQEETPWAGLGEARAMSSGALAWAPRLVADAGDGFWLAWSGRDDLPQRGDLTRSIQLRRVGETGGPTISLGLPGERSDAPDLTLDAEGFLHLVWESSNGQRCAVVHQQIGPDGLPLGEPRILSEGWLDRRPAVAASEGRVWVAWDSLVTPGPADDPVAGTPLDPDYDLFFRVLEGGAWGPVALLDGREGIQAAPRMVADPEGGVLVAYHASLPGGLVKWWDLRRLRAGRVERLVRPDPAASVEPAGEQQGAEFPQLALRPDGGVVITSRASQGAYLHQVGRDATAPPLDLTLQGWGARGRAAGLVVHPRGTIRVARRGRSALVLEHIEPLQDSLGVWSAPVFEPVDPEPAKPVLGHSAAASPPAGPRVLWGDLHMHSALSDGTGTPDEIYARCWARGLDFAALTDHDTVVGWRMLPSEHHELIDVTRLFDARPDFIALHAYEWTTPHLPRGAGHRNVYFEGLPPTPVYGYRHGYETTEKLQQALRSERAFSVPHHTTWTGTDWDQADPALQRHVEIVSIHGVAEAPGGVLPARGEMEDGWVVDGLARGAPMGFVGGTDSHGLLWHHGLGLRRDPWAHALTGVVVEEPDRDGLWRALLQRRTSASTGEPISVIARIGDLPQGGEGRHRGPVGLDYQLGGTRDLVSLTVIRDGEERAVIPLQGARAAGRWVDDAVDPGAHVYYLRVQQAPRGDAVDLAWSSPIFVTVEP